MRYTASGIPERDDLSFGRAEVRSTNGDTCTLSVNIPEDEIACPGLFSSDGRFTLLLEAFAGRVPD